MQQYLDMIIKSTMPQLHKDLIVGTMLGDSSIKIGKTGARGRAQRAPTLAQTPPLRGGSLLYTLVKARLTKNICTTFLVLCLYIVLNLNQQSEYI